MSVSGGDARVSRQVPNSHPIAGAMDATAHVEQIPRLRSSNTEEVCRQVARQLLCHTEAVIALRERLEVLRKQPYNLAILLRLLPEIAEQQRLTDHLLELLKEAQSRLKHESLALQQADERILARFARLTERLQRSLQESLSDAKELAAGKQSTPAASCEPVRRQAFQEREGVENSLSALLGPRTKLRQMVVVLAVALAILLAFPLWKRAAENPPPGVLTVNPETSVFRTDSWDPNPERAASLYSSEAHPPSPSDVGILPPPASPGQWQANPSVPAQASGLVSVGRPSAAQPPAAQPSAGQPSAAQPSGAQKDFGPDSLRTAPAPVILQMRDLFQGQAAVFHAATAFPVEPAHPARPGETLVVYVSHLGPFLPPAVPAGLPESASRNRPQLTIGDKPARVLYASLLPGQEQVFQIRVQVPQNVPSGNAVPLMLAVPGMDAARVTIPVE